MDYGAIIGHNGAWFLGVCMLSYFFGIITAWNKKFALGIIVIFGILAALSLIAVTMIPPIQNKNDYPWYYYIGAFVGGLLITTFHKFGKEKYRNWMKGD